MSVWARSVLGVAALMALAASCLLDRDGLGETIGSGTPSGTGGGVAGCQTHEDCPQAVMECHERDCLDGECVEKPSGLGDDCGEDGKCAATGECLQGLGMTCMTESDCFETPCVDGVCCDTACDGICETCNGAEAGVCVPHAAALDPDQDCGGGLCDGGRNCATGDAQWLVSFDGGSTDLATSASVDAEDNIYVIGTAFGGIDFGAGVLVGTAGTFQVALAKLNPGGIAQWSKLFDGSGSDSGRSIAATADGGMVAVGSFRGNITIEGATLTSVSDEDVWLASLNADGDNRWRGHYYGDGADRAEDIWVSPAGTMVVAGRFQLDMRIGLDHLQLHQRVGTTPGWRCSIRRALRSGCGTPRATALTWPSVRASIRTATSWRASTSTAASRPIRCTRPIRLGDVLVVKLDPDGNHMWSRLLASNSRDFCHALATDSAGNVYVGGEHHAPINLDVPPPAGLADGFVAKLDADGEVMWSDGYASMFDDRVRSITVDAADNPMIVGELGSTVDVHGVMLVPPTVTSAPDSFAVKLTAAKEPLWVKHLFGEFEDLLLGVATTPAGGLVAVGTHQRDANVDMRSVQGAVDGNMLALKLAP